MRYFKIFMVVMMLGGCSVPSAPQYDTRQPLPKAKPKVTASTNSRTVKRNTDWNDPLRAHMKARKRVNPNDRSSKRSYTKLVGATSNQSKTRSSSRVAAFVPPVPGRKPMLGTAAVARALPVSTVKTAPSPIPRLKPIAVAQSISPAKSMAHKITNMRIGNHPGKTRIVFDVDAPVTATTEMVNGGRVLYLTFEGADWQTESVGSFAGHPVLSGYEARLSDVGAIVKIQMKTAVKVSGPKRYSPNAQYKNHRISIDILD